MGALELRAKEAPGGALATERGFEEMSLCWHVPTGKGRDGGRQELLSGPERQGGRQEELPLQTLWRAGSWRGYSPSLQLTVWPGDPAAGSRRDRPVRPLNAELSASALSSKCLDHALSWSPPLEMGGSYSVPTSQVIL